MNRAIARADAELSPAPVHLSLDSRGVQRTFHRDRYSQTDVAVVRTCFEVRLQVARNLHIHAAVASVNAPTGLHLRSSQCTRRNAAVARTQIQRIKAASYVYVSIAGHHVEFSVQVPPLDVSVTRLQRR